MASCYLPMAANKIVRSQEMGYFCVDNKVGKGTFKMFLCSCLNLEKSHVQF